MLHFFSDYWQAHVKTFSGEDHFGVGKDSGLTAYIERFNNTRSGADFVKEYQD